MQNTFQVWTNAGLPYIAGASVLADTIPAIPAGATEFGEFSVTTGASGVLFLDFRSPGLFLISGIEISVGVVGGAMLLRAAGDPLDSGAAAISLDMLQPVVEAAARWSDIGLTPAQAATLSNVQFAVADLGGAYPGLANPATNTIRIDNDAARLGWSIVTGHSSLAYGQMTNDKGPITNYGVDLLTVVMHEMGHLLGSDHSDGDHDLMAPVLSAGRSLAGSSVASRTEAFEPLGQTEWQRGVSSFGLRCSSSRQDDVFADLGRYDRTADDSSEGTSSKLIESARSSLLAARTAKSGEEATQARVPRRSRVERSERELDTWFAELAEEEAAAG